MRYTGLALLASAVVLNACGGGGGDKKPADSTPTPAPAAAVEIPAGPDTVKVDMVFVAPTDFKFSPVEITAKSGDALRFVAVSGNPHNVAVDTIGLAPDMRAQFKANMKDTMSELMSMPLTTPGQVYVISLGGIKPGKYTITCPLHVANNMRATLTVH